MKYYKVTFEIKPYNEDFADILSALLSEVGFEAFEPTSEGVEGYIQQTLWDEEATRLVADQFPIPGTEISFNAEAAEYENWNKTWEEEGFRPIIIGNTIAVHNTHHTDIPQVEYDIVISPCQAFGTGSHQTTRMILSKLAETELKGKKVVDAGTGTGILAIMCMKRGAGNVFAYDIDEWSVNNTIENLKLNGVEEKVDVREGDASVLEGVNGIDFLIANINRNILLGDMSRFRKTLSNNGKMLLSGFYEEDVEALTTKAEELGMHLTDKRSEDGWAMLLFEADAAGRMDV